MITLKTRWRRLALTALYCAARTVARWHQADAASVSTYSWTNDTVYSTTDLRFEVDTEDATISEGAVFRFQLNERFGVTSNASIDTTSLVSVMDGTLAVALESHAIVLTRNSGGSVLSEDTMLAFVLTGLATPLRAGAVDIGTLVVSNSTHPSIFEIDLPSMLVKPGKIWNAQADFTSWISGRVASLQLSVMPANPLPDDGSIVITLPDVYGSLSSASLGQVIGVDGDVTLSTKLNRMSLKRAAGTGAATTGMQTIVVRVDDILHSLLEGPIGNQIRVDTLDVQDQIIDQVYIDTSDAVLRKAQVMLSTRYLSVQEGSSTGSQYTLQLSAPPVGSQLTVLVSQIANSSTADVSITPDHLVFSSSNWSTPFAITVVVNDDDVARDSRDMVVTHTIVEALTTEQTFASVNSVQILVEENDVPLIQVSSRYAAVIQGARNDTYEIVLTSKPNDVVRIDLEPADSFITTIPSYVVFSQSGWSTPQQVTIVGSAPPTTDVATVRHSRRSSVLHSPSSLDPNFSASRHFVVPQSQLQVYYEPLELDQCVEPCRPGWFSFSNSSSSESLCLPCPLGFFCSGGCANPSACPTGTFSSESFATSAVSCQECPSGSYTNQQGMIKCLTCPSGAFCEHPGRLFTPCPAGTWSGENEAQCHDCPAGSYNNETFQGHCTDCPSGYYCSKGSSAPKLCAPGTVSVSAGASPCGPCPAGYDCSQPWRQPVRCSEGTYSLVGESSCLSCPRGYACSQPDQSPQACALGMFSAANSTTCTSCAAGFSCANASVDPVPCETGTYSSTVNSSMCRACPVGYSCADPSVSPLLCPPGAYSLEGDYLCRSCPAGKYCPDPHDVPKACAPGSYSLGNATSCTLCPTGNDCSSSKQAPTACPEGFYSVNSSTPCAKCVAGYYCSSPSASPKLCLQGTYSLDGASACTSCPFGYTCATADASPDPCGLGQTNNANHSACISCPKGYECSPLKSAPALCGIGTYSLEGDNDCRSCPRGYQCPITTDPPVRCGAGSYSPVGSAQCFDCMAGFYCPNPSMDPVPCPSWHYSGASSTSCMPCPVGYDCTAPSSPPLLCPAGTFNLQIGSACERCPAGAACPEPSSLPENCIPGTFSIGGQAQCTPCAPGFYCPYTNQNTQIACLNGTYAEAGSAKCSSCPSGKQCPSVSQHVEQTCPQGTFSLSGQSQCTACPSGYKCPQVDGSKNAPCPLGSFATGSAISCTTCPAGYACPDPTSDSPIPCAAGTYSTGGATTCTPCPPGYACPDTTTSQRIQCPAGSYANGGDAYCTPCPAGYQCLLTNSSSFQPCSPGWYSPAGSAACMQCPRGYFCDTPGEMPKNCTVGSYSLNGSSSCISCDPGYECPRSDQLPQPCPVGYYSEGGEANCLLCRPGYKCSLASTNPTPPQDECPMGGYCNPPTTFFLCPAGTFGNVTGGESVDHACAPCPEGFYCEMGSTPLTKQVCPPGYFCPEAAKRASQYPCPSGTFNPLSGQKSQDACQTCPAGSYCEQGYADPEPCPHGYFCLEGTKSVDQYPCPAGTFSGPQTGLVLASQCQQCEIGSYCPESSSTPTKCPAGTYNPNVGSAGLHECLDCPPGWSCPQVGQSTYEDRCVPGHYCPSGTVLASAMPCPAGTYTERVDLIRAEDCTICPLRHACPQGTGGETQTMLDCGAGFFCPNGTAFAKQFPCLPGTWSSSTLLADASECDICPKGKYCSGGKSFIDGNCSAGYYCPLGTPSPTKFPCPSGTYTSKTWLFEPSQCDDCPPGYYCPAGSVDPIPCKPGSYTSLNRTESVGPGSAWPSCINCPAGYYCVEATVVPEPCGKGKFSTAGSKACSTCEAGYFCNSETTSATNMRADIVSWTSPGALFGKCYNGTYCPPGSDSEPALEIDACPRGYYCPTATPQPMVCPAGTYSNFTGQDALDDCVPTPAGYYSLEGALQPTGVCTPGFYCPLRSTSSTQVPCPARYYLDRTGGQSEDDCALCVAGSYCSKGSAYPVPCPAGSYCRTGIAVPEPCPIGTYANSSGLRQVEDCILCSPGMYCDSTGLTVPRGPCDPGYYCTLGAYTSAPMNYESTIFGVSNRHTGAQCPQGAYCPLGSATPTLCPPGTFNNFTGLETESQCVPCPAGQYCETPGLFLPTDSCFAGYYCTGGSSVSTQVPTPPGYYSLTGAVSPTPCPPGRFNLHSTQEQCIVCPAGFYCGSPATIQPVMCPTGTYCPESTALPVKCPPGSFSGVGGLVAENQCEACPAGFYCDSYGLSAPSGKCFEGFVCKLSSPVANPVDQAFGYICPAGQYCPAGSGAGIQCPNGTFRASIGGTNQTSCTSCPGGLYCEGTALTAPTGKCAKGYFCVSRAASATPTDNVTGDICPAGFYCGEATINPVKCASGTYAMDPGQTTCTQCPAGYFCDGLTTDRYFDCPVGHYCPLGTAAIPVPCPVGTVNNQIKITNVSDCLPCTPGFYCEIEGLATPSGPCSPGYYCPAASGNKFGKSATNLTRACPAGAYCPEGTYVPVPCPRGTYSNAMGLASATECKFCDEGSYCADAGLTKPTGLCAAGYYCKLNNTVANPSSGVVTVTESSTPGSSVSFGGNLCPQGHYCSLGTITPRQCSEGTFADETGTPVCKACVPGYYCPLGTVDYSANQCAQGYYCPEGTQRSVEFPCPPGTFGNATGLQDVSQCSPAPGGMFVDSYAAVQPTGTCKSGFYCSGGSATSTPSLGATGGPCLPGSNCPEGSAVPIVCDAGYYCSSTNTDKALPCDEGFYCVQGSYTANPTGQNNSLGMIGNVCSAGHYCPQGTSNPIPCPPGTFSENTQNVRAEDCFPCPPGYLCTVSGVIEPFEKCPPGYICTGGEREATQRCPKGFECPEGSSQPTVCPAGTFSDEDGLAQCKICPQRYFCEQGTVSPQECLGGFFCPLQTPSAKTYPCLPGTYSNQSGLGSAAECTKCPPGKFCSGEPPTDSPTADCAPGHYCSGGARTAQPVNDTTGGYCAGGYMCFGGAWLATPIDNRTGRACDAGYYCLLGSSAQIRCPKGTYNSFEEQISCATCPAGSYCDTNSTAPSPCPQRYFCPEGTIEPVLCPSGTFGHQVGLERSDQCAACGTGKYCTGGVETASCAAGYYCKMYNDEPNPDTPAANSSNIDYGGPCPIGHYCPEGVLDPFPCPNFTARLEMHGTSVDDCGPCPAGMSCEDGAVTITCPRGSYCAFGNSSISCPAGTYNPSEGKQYLEDCLPCDAGKLCNRTGVIDPTGYDCPPGHYCLVAESIPKPCPTGSFRRAVGGRSTDDCQICIGGSYCVLGSIEPIICESKVYCPKGSGLPIACPGGSYCPFNTTVPILSPEGYFCPISSDSPIKCDRGYYCPAGTTAQVPCPLGYIGRETPLSGAYTTLGDSCERCPPGMFGVDPKRLSCETCLEGYVCLGATSSSRPVSRETDRGYQCPPGYYCSAGSSRELACPSGTYQPEYGATNSTSCRECPANSYQNVAGQASCLPCSKSAFSSAGATKCTCVGSHRAFQMTDGYCICEPGYEFYDQDLILRSDEDDDVDCQPIVYDRCGSNQIRSDSGSCISVSQASCVKSCNNGTGTYVSSMGLCQCDKQPDLDLICDKKCRESSMQLQVNSTTGELQLYDPVTGQIEPLQDAVQGIVTQISCTSSDCQLHSLAIQASGFSGSYDVPSSLSTSPASSTSRRRRLATSSETSIPNPMMCLNVGSGIIFDLSTPGSYPIYLKDSMLNTNPSFDYGAFRSLASKVKSNSSSVTAFAFSFTEPGTYVFGNSLNSAAKTVIVIMSEGTSCPTDGPIVPLSEKNLISVSAKRRMDDLILAPDWGLIFGLLGGLFGMVVAIITGLYYFRTKSWTNSSLRKQLAGYRAKSKQVDLASIHSKGSLVANKITNADTADRAQEPSAMAMLDEASGARSPHAAEKGQDVYEADLGRWDDEDLDIRELVDRLQFHHESVAKCFEDQKGDVKKVTQQLQTEATELKRLFVNALLSSGSLSKGNSLLPPEHEISNPELTTELTLGRSGQPTTHNQSDNAKCLEKNGFLLENLERELIDRQRYEKKKSGAMDEVNHLLNQVESWRQELPELTTALADEMALNLEAQGDQPETTAASLPHMFLERIQNTLGDLKAVLSSDPSTKTSSSVIQLVEGEKVRREIGAFVLEESQRHLHALLPSKETEGETTTSIANEEDMKKLLDLHDAVAKAQNREDEVVHAQVTSLHKFGIVVPKVALALSELERDFKTELLKLREEQNPSKERALKQQLEGKLSKILAELSKGAGKVRENIHKESAKILKCERACHDSETQLAAALHAAKRQFNALRDNEREEAIAEAQVLRAAQSTVHQQHEIERDAMEKKRDETLFQIKDLLVALTTELNARHQAGEPRAEVFQAPPGFMVPTFAKTSSARRIHETPAKPAAATADASNSLLHAEIQLDDLRKKTKSAAQDLAKSQVQMQKQYLEKLESEFPQLLLEEKERLVGEFSSDLLQLVSSLNVETIRSEEDLRGMLTVREVAHEKQQQAVQLHAEQQESALLQEQQVQETQLEDQFKQAELEIEQEYLQELSRLEQEFEMVGSDFSEPPELESDVSEPFERQDENEGGEFSDEDREDDSAIEAEIIAKLCSTYADAWKDHLATLANEEAWRKTQLAEQLQRKRNAHRQMTQADTVSSLELDKLNDALAVEEAEELEKICEEMNLKKDALLEDLAMKQDTLDTARDRIVREAVSDTRELLDDFVRLQSASLQQLDKNHNSTSETDAEGLQRGGRLGESDALPLNDRESSPRSLLNALLDNQRGELDSILSKAEEVTLARRNEAIAMLAHANDKIQELRRAHSGNLREVEQAVANEMTRQGLDPQAKQIKVCLKQRLHAFEQELLVSNDPQESKLIAICDRALSEVVEHRSRDLEAARTAAVEASIELDAANATLGFLQEWPESRAMQTSTNQTTVMLPSQESVPSNLVAYNVMTEKLPTLIQEETASQLERLLQEHETACKDREQRLLAEQAAQKAKLAEKMAQRRAEIMSRAAPPSPAEVAQLLTEIDSQEQQGLASISAEYKQKVRDLVDTAAKESRELATLLKSKSNNAAQEIESQLRDCRHSYETEARKRGSAIDLDQARAKKVLLDRLQHKLGGMKRQKSVEQSEDGNGANGLSDQATRGESDDVERAAALHITGYNEVLHKLDTDVAQQLHHAKIVHTELQDDLKRAKDEHETALKELQMALDAERARQEQRLQQRMQQRREQQLKRNLSPDEATKTEALVAKQEETEKVNLQTQLDAQSQVAIAEEKDKQNDEASRIEVKLRLAAAEIAAAEVARKAVAELQKLSGAPVAAAFDESEANEKDDATALMHKRRVAAQLALAKMKNLLLLWVPLSPRSGGVDGSDTMVSTLGASDPLRSAIASEVETQILKISEAHIQAWQKRKQELALEEAAQKAKLAERKRQKHATVANSSPVNTQSALEPTAREDGSLDETLFFVEDTAIQDKCFRLDADLDKELDLIATCVENAVSVSVSDLEETLLACRAAYERDLDKLHADLDLERQRERSALEKRFASRRTGKPGSSSPPALDSESQADVGELARIEEQLAVKETMLVAALQMSAKEGLDGIVASAKSKTLGRYTEAQAACDDTEDELNKLRKDHAHGMAELVKALAAERKRQEDKLLERLAKRRNTSMKGATASLSGNAESDDQAQEAHEQLEKERLETQLGEQAARAVKEETDKFQALEEDLKGKLLKLRVDAEAAGAVCAAVDAAGEAELERLRREYFDSKARVNAENEDAAATHRQRLEARLASKLRKLKPVASGESVEPSSAVEAAAAGVDMLESTIQNLHDTHYRTWKNMQDRLDDEARLRKAQLAERLQRKRAELQSKAATGALTASEYEDQVKALDQEEQIKSAMISAEMTKKVVQLRRAVDNQKQSSTDALVDSFTNNTAEIDRLIDECRLKHAQEKQKLREQLEVERQRQQQSLRERIAKRRERLKDNMASPDSDVSEEQAAKAEMELDELDAREQSELECSLQESESNAWVQNEELINHQILDLTRTLEQDAEKKQADAGEIEQAALDELARVTREHQEHMKALHEAMDAEKQRKMLELAGRLQKRRDQRLREIKFALGVNDAEAVRRLEVEEELAQFEVQDELSDRNAVAIINELERQRAVEMELGEKLSQTAAQVAAAEAARKVVERVQEEYKRRRKDLTGEHDLRRQEQKHALQGRLAARKQQKVVSPGNEATLTLQKNASEKLLGASDQPDGSMEDEIQRVKDAHEVGWQARLSQLELDAAMKKARLMERMQKKRAALRSSAAGDQQNATALEPTAVQDMQQEETEALAVIDADFKAKRSQLQSEMEDEERALKASLDAAAKDRAAELERLLTECKKQHDKESENLRKQQALKRQQQEQSLQARLAKKRVQRPANGTKDGSPTGVVVDEKELLEEEWKEREAVEKQREDEEAVAMTELKERQRGEVAAIMAELDEDAERQRAAALLQQQEAERQLERLQQEHRESLQRLNESLATQKMQQEGKLQQRLLSKRARKQEELGKLQVSEEEAANALKELDREQAAQTLRFEQDWESEISRKLSEETETQKAEKLEVTRLLNQAVLGAAAAHAARKALEAANRAEIERVAAEFQSEAIAAKLQQSAEAESQKKRLQDRLAEKKQKRDKQKLKRVASIVQKSTRLIVKKPDERAGQEPSSAAAAPEEEMRLKKEHEMQLVAQQAEAAACKKQKDAKELQQQAVKELERLKEEHENEMKHLNASLLADQKRQEQKLQERIAQRRKRKQKEAVTSEGEKERLALLEEEERSEKEALEAELAARAAQRIQEEKDRQRLKEAELAARIDQAAMEAAAAEVARKAVEVAREQEIERLSKEFDEKSKELRQSNQADLATQKKKLEARIAAKKQKKLMELEAKKELELQKLKQKQAQAIEAIEEDKAKMSDALESLAAAGDNGGGGDESLPASGNLRDGSQQLGPNSDAEEIRTQQQEDTSPSSVNRAANLVTDAQQQAKDVAAIEQLFTLGLIPLQLSLLAGIELAVNQRHQAEASALVSFQYEEKMAVVRQGMSGILQQKASTKALTLADPSSSPQERETKLQNIDKAFDLKIRECEQKLLADVEQAQQSQTKALKEKQLAQIAVLLNHFASHHAVAVAKLTVQQTNAPPGGEQQQELRRSEPSVGRAAFVSKAESEHADLMNELRARLQVEKNERVRELLDEKQIELTKSHEQLERDLVALAIRFDQLIELEKAEINKTFRERFEQLAMKTGGRKASSSSNRKADEAQRTKFEAEKDAQVSRLVLMLRGRQAKQVEHLQKLAEKRREMLEDEFTRKVHVVTAKTMQRVVEEKETLARKQAMMKSGPPSSDPHESGTNEQDRAGLNSESGKAGNTLTHALEERLAKIEEMLRDRLKFTSGSDVDTESKAEEPKDPAGPESPVAADLSNAVASYRATIKDAISRGCRAESDFLLPSAAELSPERLKILYEDLLPVEAMSANMQTRLDFVNLVLQLAVPSDSSSCSSTAGQSTSTGNQGSLQVVVIKSLSEGGAASEPKSSSLYSYLDDRSQTLCLRAACLLNLSTGQLAILALHALAQAQTKRADVSDPIFISKMYEFLVQCYQSLFQSKQQQHHQLTEPAQPQASSSNRSTFVPTTSTSLNRQWQTRLNEMENFLTSLERSEGLSSSASSSTGLGLPGIESASLERNASLKRLSPSLGSSSSRSLLGKKSPSEMELFVIHERRQLLQEKLDTAEKLYTQVLRQYQEQKESLEYLQEMLTEEQENEEHEGDVAASESASALASSAQTQREVAELEAALVLTRKERDELFAHCQALRDALAQQAPTPRVTAQQ